MFLVIEDALTFTNMPKNCELCILKPCWSNEIGNANVLFWLHLSYHWFKHETSYRSDKEHDMMNSKAKYAQWTAHAAAEKSEYEKKKPKAQPTPHPDRSKSSKLCVVL